MSFLRTQNIKLSPIKQMELLASKIPDVVSLAQGIPSFDTPQIIKKAALKALNRGVVAKYSLTCGLPELRETIEQKLAEEKMYYDSEKEIICTCGSIEAITATLIAIIQSYEAKPRKIKNEVILFSPSYASYSEAVKVAGGEPVFVNLEERAGWCINLKNLAKKINSKTAAIIICNPNNPTGTLFSKEDLIKIAELAWKRKIFIILDEVYKDFVYDDLISGTSDIPKSNFFSLAQIPELRKIVIRVFSLSKAYAMTGWRIGFIHSDKENISEIIKVHDSLVTCSPVISQYAAIAALDFADNEVEKFRQEYAKRLDLICRHLDDLKNVFSYQRPNSSYFVFPKILKSKDSWKFAINLLEKARVAVVPGIAFGPSGEGHIRISFGRSERDINEAMNRIKKFLISN